MSKDTHPLIFLHQREAAFIILQFFCNTCSFENWGMSLGCYSAVYVAGAYSVFAADTVALNIIFEGLMFMVLSIMMKK